LAGGGAIVDADTWAATFLNKDVTSSVQRFNEALQRKEPMKQSMFRKLLSLVIQLAETGDLSDEAREAITADKDVFCVFNGLNGIVRSAVKNKIKDTTVAADLQKVQIPQVYAADICAAIQKKREDLERAADKQRISLPSIRDIRWRVDVTISTTGLSRVFLPVIVMQLTLSNGQISTFECPVEVFHRLRYSVAKVLKGMNDLQQNYIMTHKFD